MAQWEHKEATWYCPMIHVDGMIRSVNQISLIDGVLEEQRWTGRKMEEQNKFTQKSPSFPQWLDFHCLEGWEVFKISRDFNSKHQRTWCVFRRQV